MATEKSQIVVLSDIHIGDGCRTVWYQPSIHDAYLGGICSWIVANAATIREVVLLGDVMDTWTQPCYRKPPTFTEIIKANQQIFGPAGFFGKVLDAIDGAVTYVPGNHDMDVTAADVASIVSAGGHAMKFVSGTYYPLGDHDHRIALAHGNEFTMFNAPDPMSPRAPIPVGHFVTRMVAGYWDRNLAEGQTVATLKGQGAPNGLDIAGILKGIVFKQSVGITKAMLDSVAKQTQTPADQQFMFADGTTIGLPEVYTAYDGLFGRWIANAGGGLLGLQVAGKSALADARAYYMGWFAQRHAFQVGARVIILGHTHTPIAGLDTTLVNYANSGFECPSSDDVPPQTISFAVLDTTTMAVSLMQATNQGATIERCPAAITPVVEAGMDDSCYVVVDNISAEDLHLVSSSVNYGVFVVPPPPVIPAGTSATIWLQDRPLLPFGSSGSVTYESTSQTQVLSFTCPFTPISSNSCSGGDSFRTKSGSGIWGPPGQVQTSGHPFYVEFTIGTYTDLLFVDAVAGQLEAYAVKPFGNLANGQAALQNMTGLQLVTVANLIGDRGDQILLTSNGADPTQCSSSIFFADAKGIGSFGSTSWNQVVSLMAAGDFGGGTGNTDLALYDGQGGVLSLLRFRHTESAFTESLIANPTSVGTGWTAIVAGDFGGGTGLTDLLFYNASTGASAFRAVTAAGALQPIGTDATWRQTWTSIVTGNFGGQTGRSDIMLYDSSVGEGWFYAIGDNATLEELGHSGGWRTTWKQIISGNFGGGTGLSDLLFYDASAGEGWFFPVLPGGTLGTAKMDPDWRTTWTAIVPGRFME